MGGYSTLCARTPHTAITEEILGLNYEVKRRCPSIPELSLFAFDYKYPPSAFIIFYISTCFASLHIVTPF